MIFKRKPIIIDIEGLDGAGKTTLLEHFKNNNNAAIKSAFSKEFKEQLLYLLEFKDVAGFGVRYFCATENKKLYKECSILKTDFVLKDRGILSNLAYNCTSLDEIKKLIEYYEDSLPHIIIFINGNVNEIIKRLTEKENKDILDFYCIKNYEKILNRFQAGITLLNNKVLIKEFYNIDTAKRVLEKFLKK